MVFEKQGVTTFHPPKLSLSHRRIPLSPSTRMHASAALHGCRDDTRGVSNDGRAVVHEHYVRERVRGMREEARGTAGAPARLYNCSGGVATDASCWAGVGTGQGTSSGYCLHRDLYSLSRPTETATGGTPGRNGAWLTQKAGSGGGTVLRRRLDLRRAGLHLQSDWYPCTLLLVTVLFASVFVVAEAGISVTQLAFPLASKHYLQVTTPHGVCPSPLHMY